MEENVQSALGEFVGDRSACGEAVGKGHGESGGVVGGGLGEGLDVVADDQAPQARPASWGETIGQAEMAWASPAAVSGWWRMGWVERTACQAMLSGVAQSR